MRPTTFRALLLLALFGAVAPAFAPAALGCPFCESEIGKQVEAGIFNDDFGTNALLTLLPFPILLGIVALIHFGLPGPRGKTNPGPVSPRNEVGAPASLTRESST